MTSHETKEFSKSKIPVTQSAEFGKCTPKKFPDLLNSHAHKFGGGRESREAPPWLAPREKIFENLEEMVFTGNGIYRAHCGRLYKVVPRPHFKMSACSKLLACCGKILHLHIFQ